MLKCLFLVASYNQMRKLQTPDNEGSPLLSPFIQAKTPVMWTPGNHNCKRRQKQPQLSKNNQLLAKHFKVNEGQRGVYHMQPLAGAWTSLQITEQKSFRFPLWISESWRPSRWCQTSGVTDPSCTTGRKQRTRWRVWTDRKVTGLNPRKGSPSFVPWFVCYFLLNFFT